MSLVPAWIVLLGLVTGCATSRVVTTPAPVPPPGTPIRYAVRSDPSRLLAGRLISLDADALAFERFVPERPVHREPAHWAADRIPTGSIVRLQVRTGRGTNVGRGALIGGGIGFALGALCAAGSDDTDWGTPSGGECLVSGVVSGVAIGALIGVVSRSETWAPVPLPTRGPPEPPVTAAAE